MRRHALEFAALAVLCFLLTGNFLVSQTRPEDFTPFLDEGGIFSPLEGFDLGGGDKTWVPGKEKPSLVIVFSPDCHHCEDSIPAWREFAGSLASVFLSDGQVELTGVSLGASDETRGFLKRVSFSLPEVVCLDTDRSDAGRESAARNGLILTPQTILLEPGGVVGLTMQGPFDAAKGRILEKELSKRIR